MFYWQESKLLQLLIARSSYFDISACVSSLLPTTAYVCVSVCCTDCNCHLRSAVNLFSLPQCLSALTQQNNERTAL